MRSEGANRSEGAFIRGCDHQGVRSSEGATNQRVRSSGRGCNHQRVQSSGGAIIRGCDHQGVLRSSEGAIIRGCDHQRVRSSEGAIIRRHQMLASKAPEGVARLWKQAISTTRVLYHFSVVHQCHVDLSISCLTNDPRCPIEKQ